MESNEIVKRCIEFNNPPRIGLHFDVEPLNGKKWPVTDFGWVSYPLDPALGFDNPNNDFGMKNTSIAKSEQDKGQIKEHPLENWSDLGKLKWPDYTKKERYIKIEKEVEIFRAEGKYVYAAVPALMQLSSDLRSIESWFIDHLIHKDELGILLAKINQSRMEMLDNYHKLGVDGVITWILYCSFREFSIRGDGTCFFCNKASTWRKLLI